jgi:hypothetical protein
MIRYARGFGSKSPRIRSNASPKCAVCRHGVFASAAQLCRQRSRPARLIEIRDLASDLPQSPLDGVAQRDPTAAPI